jgi:hypothetical protein
MKWLVVLISLTQCGCAVYTGASVAVWAATDHTLTDHAVGTVINRDCRTHRVLNFEAPCQEHLEPYNQNAF